MRLHVVKKLPHTLYVACSGGIDSMVLLHHCIKNRRDVKIAHFHHGTEFGEKGFEFVSAFAKEWGIQMETAFTKLWYNHEGRLYVAGKIDYVNQTVTVGFHNGDVYISYVVNVNRDGLTLEMYLRQMMIIMHCFDVSTLYFTED